MNQRAELIPPDASCLAPWRDAYHVIFAVYGDPAPQGSKRFVGMKGGRGLMVESSKRVKPWRQDVVAAATAAMAGAPPLDGPLAVRMIFTLPKPSSAPKRRRTWPNKKPDVSKLARSTEDALVTAGAIADDARIVEYERLAKVFPNEDPEALPSPGVRIEIRRLEAGCTKQSEVLHDTSTTQKTRVPPVDQPSDAAEAGGVAGGSAQTNQAQREGVDACWTWAPHHE